MNIQFRDIPGALCDFMQVVVCKTEKRDKWISKYVYGRRQKEDVKEIEEKLTYFHDLNKKLLFYGYRTEKKSSFIGYLLMKYFDEVSFPWSMDEFINYITTIDIVKDKLLRFFFDREDGSDLLQLVHDDLEMEPEIKSLLYEFLIFPEQSMNDAKSEFKLLAAEIKGFRSQMADKLQQIQDEFDYDSIVVDYSPYSKKKKWDKGIKNLTVSITLIGKYMGMSNKRNEHAWLVLGQEHLKTLSEGCKDDISISGYGNALGDPMRVRIIEKIAKYGELSLADLAKSFNVANTVIMYHMDILKKQNLLISRHQGRKVLYCLNKDRFTQGVNSIINLYGGNQV